MGKIASSPTLRRSGGIKRPAPIQLSLYASANVGGERKYLNQAERQRVLAAAETFDIRQSLFALTLAWTGARISEVLALTPRSFQIDRSLVAMVTLKRRRWSVREVPIPPDLMRALASEFELAIAQVDHARGDTRLWAMNRVTAWRLIKRVMGRANVSGRSACPRGLRHAFGVGTLQAGIPITLLQRWMGHARLTTTAIYATVSGPEEFAMAKKFWDW